MKRLFVLIVGLSVLQVVNAQYLDNEFFATKIKDSTAAKTSIYVDYLAFFKNNEYPAGITDGYTLLGNQLKTYIELRTVPQVSFFAGVVYNKFFWTDSLFLQPLLRLQADFNRFHVIMGNIYPAANHGHLTQIYDFERTFTMPAEHGIQLIYDSKYFSAETWLDWWRFIFYGSRHPENFHVGGNYNVFLVNDGNNRLYANYQMLFAHTGGEIDSSQAYTVTVYNAATGVKYSYKSENLRFDLSVYSLVYKDLTGTQKYPYQSGNAKLYNASVGFKGFTFYAGYWNAENYIAPAGEMYFTDLNLYNYATDGSQRRIMFQFDYRKDIKAFSLRTGFFYHFTGDRPNYGYYLYMRYRFREKINL